MTRDEAVARIKAGLGFRPDLDSTIVSRLQEAQRELEMGKTLPDWLIEHDATLTLLTGENTVALPSDFIREYDNEPMRYLPSDSDVEEFIPRRIFADASPAYYADDPTGPKVYILRSTDIRFFPTADADYTLTWSYYRRAALLETDIENEWLEFAPEVLIGEAGYRTAMDLRDADGVALFDKMRQTARISLYTDIVVREESGGPIYMGSNL